MLCVYDSPPENMKTIVSYLRDRNISQRVLEKRTTTFHTTFVEWLRCDRIILLCIFLHHLLSLFSLLSPATRFSTGNACNG